MLPPCNPCYRHTSTAVPRETDVRGRAMLPASGAARRSPCLSWAGAGRAGGRGGAASPTAGPDDTVAGYRRGAGAGAGAGAGPGLASRGECPPAAPRDGKRSPAAPGPLDPDLLHRVTLLFSGGGIEIDTGRTREISIERGCYGTRDRTLSGSAAGRPRTPPARGGSRPLSFMPWPVRRGPRAFRSGRSSGSRSIETGSPIGEPLILKEW